MNTITSLVKRMDTLLAAARQKQQQQPGQRVVISLPLKTNEPQISYKVEHRTYTAYFYAPGEEWGYESRQIAPAD